MSMATKADLMAHRGPEPWNEQFTLPGLDLTISIRGIVRSSERSDIYREVEHMSSLKVINLRGERVPVVDDDIAAACWASACVKSPKLTAMEWLMVGCSDSDLLTAVATRCLVCSRIVADEIVADGVAAAEKQMAAADDPLVSSPSSSVSTSLEGCQRSSNARRAEPVRGFTPLTIV